MSSVPVSSKFDAGRFPGGGSRSPSPQTNRDPIDVAMTAGPSKKTQRPRDIKAKEKKRAAQKDEFNKKWEPANKSFDEALDLYLKSNKTESDLKDLEQARKDWTEKRDGINKNLDELMREKTLADHGL